MLTASQLAELDTDDREPALRRHHEQVESQAHVKFTVSKQTMSKFIELPNGDTIRAESIIAIRMGDHLTMGKMLWECELAPRIIVYFAAGTVVLNSELKCKTVEERDKLAEEIKARLREIP